MPAKPAAEANASIGFEFLADFLRRTVEHNEYGPAHPVRRLSRGPSGGVKNNVDGIIPMKIIKQLVSYLIIFTLSIMLIFAIPIIQCVGDKIIPRSYYGGVIGVLMFVLIIGVWNSKILKIDIIPYSNCWKIACCLGIAIAIALLMKNLKIRLLRV
jgi:hypothetical protein